MSEWWTLPAGGLPDVLAAHLLAAVRIAEPVVLAGAAAGGVVAALAWLLWFGAAAAREAAPRASARRWALCWLGAWPGPSCWQRYAPINWAADDLCRWPSRCRGWGCWRWPVSAGCRAAPSAAASRVGLGLLLWALLGHPLLARAGRAGRGRRPRSSAWRPTRRPSARWAGCWCCGRVPHPPVLRAVGRAAAVVRGHRRHAGRRWARRKRWSPLAAALLAVAAARRR